MTHDNWSADRYSNTGPPEYEAEVVIITSQLFGTTVYGPDKDEVTEKYRKVHNVELHNIQSWPNIV